MFGMPALNDYSFGDSNRLRYTQLANQQYSNKIGGLLSGMPVPKNFGPLSADFLSQVYDAKALSPKILSSYLNRTSQTLEKDKNSVENPASKEKAEFESYVDKMLAQKQAEMDQEKQNLINPGGVSKGIDILA